MTRTEAGRGEAVTPARAVQMLIDAAEVDALDLHSVLLMRGGRVLAEAYRAPFDADTPHRMYSVTKSFTSSAVGLAVDAGLLTVEDRVVDIFPERTPHPADPHLGALRVRHLLTMSAGHGMVSSPSMARPVPSIADFMGEAMEAAPGSRFDYSNHASYMLSAIVQRVSGEVLDDFLRPRLLDPLGIAAENWLRSPEGVANGGWGLHLTTRELSRLGQLYLQRGMWDGRRLLSEAWIAEATGRRVPSWGSADRPDWNAGYGYQFWRGRHDSFRADGLLGQFCMVLPALDALLVTTTATMRTQRLLDLVWTHMVPALSATRPEDDEAAAVTFADFAAGGAGSPRAAEMSGISFRLGEHFMLPTRFYGGQSPLTSIGVEAAAPSPAVLVGTPLGRWRLPVGLNQWAGGVSPVSTGYPEPYAGFARWTGTNQFAVELVFTEGGYRMGLTFDLDPAQVTVRLPVNPGLDGRVVIGRPFP